MKRAHAKKSSAQLDREIAAFLQARAQSRTVPAIPDQGYMVAQHGGSYLTSFGSKDEALRFARGLAEQTRESYDIVKVQNRGNDRFVVDEVMPRSWSPSRAHATKKAAQLYVEGTWWRNLQGYEIHWLWTARRDGKKVESGALSGGDIPDFYETLPDARGQAAIVEELKTQLRDEWIAKGEFGPLKIARTIHVTLEKPSGDIPFRRSF